MIKIEKVNKYYNKGKANQIHVIDNTSMTLPDKGIVCLLVAILFFVLCGLCTSVMWGAVFNLAVEGLGKYTSIASGLFMVMVCGGGLLPLLQGAVADFAGYINSYWVLVAALVYMLWFAIVGSKPKKF